MYFKLNLMFKKFLYLIAVFILCSLTFFACPDPPIDDEIPRITTISLEGFNTSCVGTDLKIAVEDTIGEWTFDLIRNDSLIMTSTVFQRDTIIHDGGLSPNTLYNYQAFWMDGATRKDTSNLLTVFTNDTTSHNFVWEIDTIGLYGSFFTDAEIVNENDIWVVGKIVMDDPDSSFNGTGKEDFNAAHWNGNEWEILRIRNVARVQEIQYFAENDIWFVQSGYPVHWDGNEWTLYHLHNMGLDVSALTLWGSSSDNMYFTGIDGGMVHYNGNEFTLMETEHEVRMLEMHGTPDGEYVFAIGRDFFDPAYSVAYQIHDGVVETLYYCEKTYPTNDTDLGAFSSVYVYSDTAYFVTRQGLWKYNYLTRESSIDRVINNYEYNSLCIKGLNDIFMKGGGGMYVHYNGATWDFNEELYDGTLNTLFTRAHYKGDMIVSTGHFNTIPGGMIAIGRR